MLHDVFPSQFVYMALSVLENCPSLVQEGNKDIHHEFGRGDDEIKREQSNSDDSSREQGSALNLDDSREDLEEGEIDEDVDGNNACEQSKDNKKDKKERKRKRRHHKHSEEEDGKDDKSKKKKLRKHHKYEKSYRDHDDISTADFMKAGSPAGPYAGAAASPTPYDLLLRGAAHSPHENELGPTPDNNGTSSSPHIIKPRHRRKPSREKPNHHMGGRIDLRRDRDRRRMDMSPKKAPLCKYYMEGKCQKGDNCPFSHNATPPRKMEVCKFYILDCCAKKDKCLYMHSDFPCKFFHTGAKCFSEGKCKYSHNPLTDITRSILLRQHLETAPKEILGDFQRLTREGAQAMVTSNDISSPGEENPVEKEESEDEKENSLYGDNPSSLKEESPTDDQIQAAHINLNFYRESSSYEEGVKSVNGPQNGGGDTGDIENCPKSQLLDITHKVDQESDESALSVPQHLPKRQRELFIRIQQQQLQRQETSMENSESSKETMERANTPQSPNNENNWYSSEDEDESGENLLSGVLKKLQQNTTSSHVQSFGGNAAMKNVADSFDFDISKINLPTNIAKVLSSLKSKSDSDTMRAESTLLCRNNDSKMCGDVDLRTNPFSSEPSQDSDMRQKDTDLRNFFGDTDLRSLQTVKRLCTEREPTDDCSLPSHSDVDLRSESLLGLPFKPIPDHIPCKEIDASLGSHPPIKYRLHTVANRGKPDYSQVKLSGLESRVQSDPRLQKVVPKRRCSTEVTETSQPTPGTSDSLEKHASSSQSNVPSSPIPNPPISVPVRKIEEVGDSVPKVNPNDPRLSKIVEASGHLISSSEPVERDPRKSKGRARPGDGDIHPCANPDPRSNRSEPLLETPILNVNPPGGRCALLPTPNLDPRYIDLATRGMALGGVHGPVIPHQYYNHEHMGYMGYNQNPNFMPSDDIPVDHWGRGSWNSMPRGRGRGRGRWRGAPKTVYNRTNYSKDNRKLEKEANWEKEENWDEEEKWDKEEKCDRSEKCADNVKWDNKVETKEERWEEDENWDNDQELKDVFANKDPTASPFV